VEVAAAVITTPEERAKPGVETAEAEQEAELLVLTQLKILDLAVAAVLFLRLAATAVQAWSSLKPPIP
jgi:hypothetical protein